MPSRTIVKVITTAFFTHCLKNLRHSLALLLAWACLAWAVPAAVHAEAPLADISQLRLERSDEGVYLSASLKFELPTIVEDALLKGIPMFFVAEAEVFRDRWYWYDKKVASVSRHMRLAYQPLTRKWRLNVSPGVIGNAGLGVSFNQNFDDLPDALAAVRRISRWKIAEPSDIEPDSRHNVEFRFRLDVSQLPRPFQIGTVGQSEWNIAVARNQRLALEGPK